MRALWGKNGESDYPGAKEVIRKAIMLDEILAQQTGRLKELVKLAKERNKMARKRNMLLLGIIIGVVITIVVTVGFWLYLGWKYHDPGV